MTTWIALLRGIGGNYTVPSKMFVEILEELGAKDAKTWIATGNAVFRSRAARRDALARKIRDAIETRRGFAPDVMLLLPAELEQAIAANPYPEGEDAPATLHLVFLSGEPAAPDLGKLESLRQDGERFALKGQVFYVLTPNGAGRSKLFARTEKSLGVRATARNWRSACRILALAKSLP